MAQGRQALYDLMNGKVHWPPVVVPFGLDPFGWHGERESYRELCDFALENCTLLPKVYSFTDPLAIGKGEVEIISDIVEETDGTFIRRYELTSGGRTLVMEEIQTPGDSSWKNRKRWIENDGELDFFLGLKDICPTEPDIEGVRKKERQVGEYGLPYVETPDPFYIVCEMFPTDEFFIKTLNDIDRIEQLIRCTSERMLYGIEKLCRNAGCPFILRLIGAEMAAPPFMSSDDFLRFEGAFYQRVIEITKQYDIPASFHCHGPVSDIIDIVWNMGFTMMEPFEPPPNGDVTIQDALDITSGRGIVMGGVDDVVINSSSPDEVKAAVKRCLDGARGTGKPFILSQSSTPFSDPLSESSREKYLLFLKLGVAG